MKYIVKYHGELDHRGTRDSEEIIGFYSRSQPNYEWSFTPDIKKAKIWKTQKGAENHIQHQRECSYKTLNTQLLIIDDNYHIIGEVDVNKVEIIINNIYKNQIIDEDFWS